VVTVLGFLAGCTGSRGLDTSKPVMPDDVVALVQRRNAEIRAVTATGSISIDTPELSNSGSIEMNILKPDSMMFEISGPFGVRVAKGLVTSRQFVFYNSLENTVAEAATTSKNLKSILRLSIEFADALAILSGSMGIAPRSPDMKIAGALEGQYYRITYTNTEWTEEYLVDLSYEAVKQYTRRNASGELVEEILFKDFRKKSGVYMPGIISIERQALQESFVLSYEQQKLNDLPIDFTFKVPKSATKIKL
jgi:hypothetical protein